MNITPPSEQEPTPEDWSQDTVVQRLERQAMTDPNESCGCEHMDHESWVVDTDGVVVRLDHEMFGVPAGLQVAHYVGRICDPCANGHMTGYVVGRGV